MDGDKFEDNMLAEAEQPNGLNLIRDRDLGVQHDTIAILWRAMLVRLSNCRILLWWLLSTYFVFLVLSATPDFLTEVFEFEKICQIIPVTPASLLGCEPEESFTPDFQKLVTLQLQLQSLMGKSTNRLAVGATDFKRSEILARDLTTLVKLSSLASKDTLTKNLQKFVENSSATCRSLQKFAGHVGSAVDQTIAMNEHVIEILGSMAADKKASPLTKLRSLRTPAFRNSVINSVWFKAIEQMKMIVEKLIYEAMANEQALDELDSELTVIYLIVAEENIKTTIDTVETVR
ncbi:hypothetical protein FRC09_016309 [Ceratobasidium sp. 395]|nr:hypothetical protein FRC09_016309 [Ceratobasidium sp. 395]